MTKVIKEVVAEIRGKSDQFAAEMAKVEARTKQTKTSVEALGTSQGAMGQRTAEAARQIASATETIARQGKVTGEAGKQIVAQASNIAFAFGPQGALIGALGIFALAFGSAMTRAKREAAEASESVKKSIADMLNAGDVEALKADARRLYFGTRAEGFRDGIQSRTARLAEMRAELEGPSTNPFNVLPRMRAIETETAALKALEEQYQKVREAIFGFTQDPAAVGGYGATRITATAPGARGKGLPDGTAAGAALQKDAQAFAQSFAALITRELGGAGDQIRAEFNALISDALDAGRENAVDQLIALRDQAVAAAEAIGRAEDLLQQLDITGAQGIAPGVEAFQQLTASADELRAQLTQLVPGTERYKQVLAEIEKIEKRRSDLMNGVADAGAPGSGKATRNVAEYARQLQQAADGALQLAQNLGGASAKAVGLLRAIGQIAGNLPALSEAIKAGGAAGIIGASLPILGAVSSLIGPSPAEQQRREELRANTDALRKLTMVAGFLGSGVTGDSAIRSSQQLQSFLGSDLASNSFTNTRMARGLAQTYGLNLEELDDIAERHGITLNDNIDSFRQLAAAIASTIDKLGEFGTDLDSQLKQASAAAEIFGITDPLALLNLQRGAYAGRSPALDQAFAGQDLSTAEGRAAARTALQDLFRIMEAGGDRLNAGQLGTLSPEQLLQALLDLTRGLNDIDESLGLNTSTVGEGSRVIRANETQITADQASRLLGVATSSLAELRLIRAALTASAAGLPIPALSAGFATAGITVTITQEFHGLGSMREAAAVARSATLDAIDQGLGRRMKLRERHQGKAVRS